MTNSSSPGEQRNTAQGTHSCFPRSQAVASHHNTYVQYYHFKSDPCCCSCLCRTSQTRNLVLCNASDAAGNHCCPCFHCFQPGAACSLALPLPHRHLLPCSLITRLCLPTCTDDIVNDDIEWNLKTTNTTTLTLVVQLDIKAGPNKVGPGLQNLKILFTNLFHKVNFFWAADKQSRSQLGPYFLARRSLELDPL